MKIPYFCCIGAELKRYAQDFDFMNQVYLYKVPTDDNIDEVLSEDYFKAISNSVLQDDIVYIYEASAETLHECRFDKQNGHITAVPLASDETLTGAVTSIIHDNLTPNKLLKSDENGKVAASDFSENDFVKKSGDTMTGPLKMRATSSFQCAIAPFWDGVGFYKLNSDDSVTLIAYIETPDGFLPWVTNTYNIGSSLKKWKNLYLAGKAYMSVINNGYDIAVPVTNSPQTLALKSEVDLAANSGSQLYTTGVWYAKMYAATVVPTGAEYNGRKYADFSQVDSDNNPVIKIYTGASGAWTLTETITPPANYNGYITVTSKIWDIAEQSGQQGGKVLWDYTHKTFTPYPQIISFENAALTGTPTAPTLNASSPSDQIVNKQTLENALVNHGTGRNVGDVFLTMRNDNELNGAVECDGATYNTTDFTGAQSIGALLEAGKIDYISLAAYSTAISTKGWCDKIGWNGTGTTQFRVPTLTVYIAQKTLGLVTTTSVNHVGGSVAMRLGTTNSASAVNRGAANPICTYGENGIGTNSAGGSWGAQHESLTPINLVVDASNDVSEQRVMIQLAVAASDEALETCTGVLADVAALKYDYVVEFQKPTSSNSYTWYRKYKSGWVEQGGVVPAPGSNTANTQVVLPIVMADNNYTITTNATQSSAYSSDTGTATNNYATNRGAVTNRMSTTGFYINFMQSLSVMWEVKGMASS